MVQLFKRIFHFLTKKPDVHFLLDFNIENLSSTMEQVARNIHKHKGDDALELIKLAVLTARNIQMLEIQRVTSGKDITQSFSYHLGRLEALSDLGKFIELALDEDNFKMLNKRRSDEIKPKILKKSYGSAGPVI